MCSQHAGHGASKFRLMTNDDMLLLRGIISLLMFLAWFVMMCVFYVETRGL